MAAPWELHCDELGKGLAEEEVVVVWLLGGQQYVAQAVDMLIGQRAQVIIGNGVSGRFACCISLVVR